MHTIHLPYNCEARDGDLILLLSSGWKTCGLGLILAWDPDIPSLPTLAASSKQMLLVVCEGLRGGWIAPGLLQEGMHLDALFLGNVVTSVRECRALDSVSAILTSQRDLLLKQSPSFETIQPIRSSMFSARPAAMSAGLWRQLSAELNADQLSAVQRVCESDATTSPLLLLHGPPGTGKTQTILGIISAVLCGCTRSLVAKRPIVPGCSFQLSPSTKRLAAQTLQLDAKRPVRSRIKVLVCAPSNTAVDEIVLRLRSDGLLDTNGGRRSAAELRVVRVYKGNARQEEGGDEAVIDFSLDALVEAERRAGFKYEGDIRACLLEEADIIACTLSAAGSRELIETALSDSFAIDCLIVDEATQAVEISTLIPFKFRPRIVVLVGDPCQLRPTVLMPETAAVSGYSVSLFERLTAQGHPTLLLRQQYRMHPLISAHPSTRYYGGQLVDSQAVRNRRPMDFHSEVSFKPFVVHQVRGCEITIRNSVLNMEEAAYARRLYEMLRENYPGAMQLRIGVVAPYAAMRDELTRLFRSELSHVSVATVDGFQGREKDVIIFCTTRSSRTERNKGTMGFIGDRGRINVAITRAKHALWSKFTNMISSKYYHPSFIHCRVVGDLAHLADLDPEWAALAHYANSIDSIVNQSLVPTTLSKRE
jgi:DNA polymerase III delta prime subunit